MRIFKQSDTGTFIQFELGKDMYYLGDCIDLDTIPNPRFGGIDLIQCWNRSRTGFNTFGSKKTAPGNIEVTLTDLYSDTASWLERMAARCPFTLYALQRDCGDVDIPSNWKRGSILYNSELQGDELGNVASHTEENEMTKAYTIVGWPPRVDIRRLAATRQTTAATTDLNALAVLDLLSCGSCSPFTIPGENAITGSDRIGGAAPALYEKYLNGAWTATAASPFGADIVDLFAAVMFQNGAGITRYLVARGTLAATPMEVAYSDDRGATWTVVAVGATNAEAATGPKSLFALDREHIWLGTDSGNIFFSADGGESWTDQGALGATGAADVNAISFCDENIGYAVCDGDVIIGTVDGGNHWYAQTATGSGVNLLSVQCFSLNRVLVGTAIHAAGSLYMTFDATATWTAIPYSGYATNGVADMSFATPGVGLIVTNTAGILGQVLETIDGGNSWQVIDTVPTNSGLNAVVMFDVNGAFVVGVVQGGTAMILSLGG